MRFVDREEELKLLERYYKLSSSRLVALAIYGLRRVGKTRLVREFAEGKESVYLFVSDAKPSQALLKEFEEELKEAGVPDYVSLRSWRDFVRVLFDHLGGKVVVIDEFQNFLKVAPEVLSHFQREIDAREDTPMMLVFIGSLVGVMKDLFESSRPLFGRVRNLIHLKPFSFKQSVALAREVGIWDMRRIVELYSIFGGFPRYWEAVEELGLSEENLEEVIRGLFLSRYAPFLREGFYLVGTERKTYLAILEAIAVGMRKLSDIASYLGVSETQLSGPMSELVDRMEVLIRERPVLSPRRTRRSLYRIGIPILRFWFRFVYRFWSLVELEAFDALMERVRRELHLIISEGFEEVAREFVASRVDGLVEIGRWWRKGVEIDLVAVAKSGIRAYEVKWSDLSFSEAMGVIKRLISKSRRLGEVDGFGIVARRIEGKEKIRAMGFEAYDLADIEEYAAAGADS